MRLLVAIFYCIGFTVQAQYPAIIKKEVKNISHDMFVLDGYTIKYTRETEIFRSVLIQNQAGLEAFSTLYIPTYEDFDYEFILVNLEAKTIKSDGNEVIVDKSNIRETTLPANAPFLFGYEGKVKQLAFESLEIGDIVEYNYTIRLVRSLAGLRLNATPTYFLGNEYPTEEGVFSVTTIGRLKHKQHYFNIDEPELDEDGHKVTFRYSNLPGFHEEKNSIPFENRPYIISHIYDKYSTEYENWSDLLNKALVNPSRKEHFFGGLDLKELALVAENKSSTTAKLSSIKNEIEATYQDDIGNTLSYYEGYDPDLYDVSQMLKLLRMLKIDCEVVFAKSKYNGPIAKNLISFNQFDGIFLKYLNSKGEIIYWDFFTPFSKPDQLEWDFLVTEALQINSIDRKRNEDDFITITRENFGSNGSNFDVQVELNLLGDIVVLDISERASFIGQYTFINQASFNVERIDSEYDFFTRKVHQEIESRGDLITVDSIRTLEDTFGYDARMKSGISYYGQELITLSLQNVIGNQFDLSVGSRMERQTNAHMGFANSKTYEIKFLKPDRLKYVENSLISLNYENKVGQVNSTFTIDENGHLIITLLIETKQDTIQKDSWESYVELADEINILMEQKILLKKER